MNVTEAIQTKRAVRKFNPEPLSQEAVLQILNAGRRAQSSKNMQPWHFIAVQNKDTLEKLSKMGEWAGHLAGAALGVVIITRDPLERFSVMFDSGQAAAYMQLQAWDLGIGSCLATIYQPENARELLGFPEDMHIHVAISFGYPQEAEKLTQPPKKGGRRGFDETVHWEKW